MYTTESNCDRNKTLSVEEYLEEIKPYLKHINNLMKSDACKIQLILIIKFIYSKDTHEEYVTKKSWLMIE